MELKKQQERKYKFYDEFDRTEKVISDTSSELTSIVILMNSLTKLLPSYLMTYNEETTIEFIKNDFIDNLNYLADEIQKVSDALDDELNELTE